MPLFADILPAIVWFVITAIFIVAEFISVKYFLPVAMGAGIAAIATFFSLSIFGQVIVFAIVCVLGYLFFKPNKRFDNINDRKSNYSDDDFDEWKTDEEKTSEKTQD